MAIDQSFASYNEPPMFEEEKLALHEEFIGLIKDWESKIDNGGKELAEFKRQLKKFSPKVHADMNPDSNFKNEITVLVNNLFDITRKLGEEKEREKASFNKNLLAFAKKFNLQTPDFVAASGRKAPSWARDMDRQDKEDQRTYKREQEEAGFFDEYKQHKKDRDPGSWWSDPFDDEKGRKRDSLIYEVEAFSMDKNLYGKEILAAIVEADLNEICRQGYEKITEEYSIAVGSTALKIEGLPGVVMARIISGGGMAKMPEWIHVKNIEPTSVLPLGRVTKINENIGGGDRETRKIETEKFTIEFGTIYKGYASLGFSEIKKQNTKI